jgi:hypothetical protein
MFHIRHYRPDLDYFWYRKLNVKFVEQVNFCLFYTKPKSNFVHCLKKNLTYENVRFEVFTAVRVMFLFWVLALCRLVGRCQ